MKLIPPDVNDRTLTLVRGIGFDTIQTYEGTVEKVFFIGPRSVSEPGILGAHATEDAIKEFIGFSEHQIQVAKDYLANGRSNRTDQWTKGTYRATPEGLKQ